MTKKETKGNGRKRRSISPPRLVKEIRKAVEATGVTEDISVHELIDQIKDSYFQELSDR